MKQLIKILGEKFSLKKQPPLVIEDVIEAQKKMVKAGLPFLPADYIDFLRVYNGLKGKDCGLLGINTEDATLDIVKFNKMYNNASKRVVLGYDDFCFLVYDSTENIYLLIDRIDGSELDDFLEDEFESAINSIVHF